MANKYEGEETVEVGKDVYLCKVDFRFLVELKEMAGMDPAAIFTNLNSGDCDPDQIKSVVVCALRSENGKSIEAEEEKKDIAENIIAGYGLQECWLLSQHLLSYAMIGEISKMKLQSLDRKRKFLELVSPFQSENLKNLLLLWGWHLLIFGLSACFSFSLFVWLISKNTDFALMVQALVQ